jgi:hypothetical protein
MTVDNRQRICARARPNHRFAMSPEPSRDALKTLTMPHPRLSAGASQRYVATRGWQRVA